MIGLNEFGSRGAKALAKALAQSHALTSLQLGLFRSSLPVDHNTIGDEGAEAIADSLVQNRTLAVLSLGILVPHNPLL
ncbi:MAG: hypothetical protein P4L50_29010 [Anaerolineaceae bacterium]|nr:hypothetical protein [Anaerolineaceae bacterium]